MIEDFLIYTPVIRLFFDAARGGGRGGKRGKREEKKRKRKRKRKRKGKRKEKEGKERKKKGKKGEKGENLGEKTWAALLIYCGLLFARLEHSNKRVVVKRTEYKENKIKDLYMFTLILRVNLCVCFCQVVMNHN